MSDKFLAVIDGRLHEVRPVQHSAGASDSGKIFALDSSGLIDKSAIPLEVASDIGSVVAGEDLSAGDFVNVYYDGSDVRVRPADASASGREATGFVLDSASAGESVTVYFDGTNDHLSGLTAGELYCLAPTAGTVALRSSVSAVPGNFFQVVGRAISSTAISFDPSPPVVFSSAGVARYMFVDGGVLHDGAAASQSSGSPDAGRIVALGSDGVLDDSLLPDPSIGDNVSGASAGSVLFSGSGGALSQDNSNLFWDASSHRLGVGTATPSSDLDVNGVVSVPGGNSDEWNAAYGWGDHSVAGYLSDISGESISDLSDVDSSMAPSDGQVLTYDSANGWQAEDVASDVHSITDLSDVDSSMTPADGQVLTYDSTNGWQAEDGVSGAQSITDLTDVDSSMSPSDGQVLTYDDTNGWQADYPPSGGGGDGDVSMGEAIGFATAGSVLFIDSDSELAQDNSNLFWDATNKRLGVGTDAPSELLDVSGGSLRLDNTTYANQNGVIYKDGTPFIHNSNYGDNGTVTTEGHNFFAGEGAGNFTMGSTATDSGQASNNVGIGCNVLHANTTGNMNVAIGSSVLSSNTTGYSNVAIGRSALRDNTAGYSNFALGQQALIHNTTGYYNVAVGAYAFIGNTTGSHNIAIGDHAGKYADGLNLNQTAEGSLFLGKNTKAHADGETNQIVVGSDSVGLGSNTVVLGNDDIVTTALKGNVGVGTTTPGTALDVNGVISVPGGNSDNWNAAYGWGDHALAGYLSGISGESIADLSDVDSSMSPSDGQVLTYDDTNGWQAEDVAVGVQSIADLSDVDSTMAPADGQVLTYDSTNGWQAEDGGGSAAPAQEYQDVTSDRDLDTTYFNTGDYPYFVFITIGDDDSNGTPHLFLSKDGTVTADIPLENMGKYGSLPFSFMVYPGQGYRVSSDGCTLSCWVEGHSV